jgi:hypothetical protein
MISKHLSVQPFFPFFRARRVRHFVFDLAQLGPQPFKLMLEFLGGGRFRARLTSLLNTSDITLPEIQSQQTPGANTSGATMPAFVMILRAA